MRRGVCIDLQVIDVSALILKLKVALCFEGVVAGSYCSSWVCRCLGRRGEVAW